MENNEKPIREAIEPLYFILVYILVLLGILFFVVPHYIVIFADMGNELPAITELLLGLQYWLVVPLCMLGLIRFGLEKLQARWFYCAAVHILGIGAVLFVVAALLVGVLTLKATI